MIGCDRLDLAFAHHADQRLAIDFEGVGGKHGGGTVNLDHQRLHVALCIGDDFANLADLVAIGVEQFGSLLNFKRAGEITGCTAGQRQVIR